MIQHGECPVCQQWKRLTKNGYLMAHASGRKTSSPFPTPPMCVGHGLPPVGSELEPPVTGQPGYWDDCSTCGECQACCKCQITPPIAS